MPGRRAGHPRRDPHGISGLTPRKGLIERVTRSADSSDWIALARAVHGLAQAADMDVDRALVDLGVHAPDAVEQLGSAEDAAGALHQEFQHAEFGGTEMQLASAPAHALGLAVEDDVAA